MAFTKAPSQSTYQNKDLKLIWAMSNRSGSLEKDPLLVNGFFDIVRDKASKDEDFYVVKRDGCFPYPWESPSNVIRGLYYWEDQDKLYVAYADKIAIITASNGLETATITPFSTTEGEVSFTEFYYEDGTSKVVVGDGTTLITLDSTNTLVTCSDPDLPAFVPNLLFLDGYLFLIKKNTADIYNSALNDPMAWTPGDFISAEMLPDTVIKISRLNNYLVVFGSSSIEYFFDAGNASGSPLQRNDTPVKQIGYIGGYTTFGNKIIFVGQYSQTEPEIFILEDFKMEEITLSSLRRIVQQTRDFSASIVSNGGRDFYVLSANGETYVLDLETRLWSTWAFKQTASFDIRNALSIFLASGYVSLFTVHGDTRLYFFVPSAYADHDVIFTFSGTTQRVTNDTMNRKFMSRLCVYADKTAGGLKISWTDDDYQTFSAPREVSLNNNRPTIHRLGSFFSRAFKFSFTENQPCRIMNMEVAFNIGAR